MARQNRVAPTGEILAHPARGALMGNRGILHDDAGRLTHRRWRHKAWVCCVIEFRGRRRSVMSPRSYTELFFHDEAVALAAGHRPCGECRRAALARYRQALGHEGPVATLDARLHRDRAIPRRYEQRRDSARAEGLPEGCFVLDSDCTPLLLWQGAAHPLVHFRYGPPRRRPTGKVTVLTPATTRAALAAGYVPMVRLD